ncbi:MAG: anion permease [Lachnospiraceae bacterium]|nr:anion permease [Lachnospiraceae bacterium]
MAPEQISALIIFIAMFVLIVADKFPRQYITLVCGLLTIVVTFGICMRSGSSILESLNLKAFTEPSFWIASEAGEEASAGINWATILFIGGMMVMVEGMAKAGFFQWLCMRLAKLVNYKPIPLMIAFMVMSFALAMFIDSITVILFLAAVTIELGKLLKMNPVPMIIAEIFCANLGGSATMSGDPPNIIIGTSLHYSFTDFLLNTGAIALIQLILIVGYYILIYYKTLKATVVSEKDIAEIPEPSTMITNKRDFIISTVIFLCAIVLLVTHNTTGLTVATIGVGVAIASLLAAGKSIPVILKKVDYDTLLFFIGLFVVVSGLEITGILELLAKFIKNISGGNIYVMVAIILWLSAIASAVVDNIPFAATMIPVIKALAETTTGVPLTTLAWTLAIGTDVGGNATPIGASANVVGVSVAEKNGHPIGWGKYCKASIPATILVIATSMIYLFIRYC